MDKELTLNLGAKSDEDLFCYFKHDGSINFEKKIIAGTILKKRNYNKKVLSKEKDLIVESYTNRLKLSKNPNYFRKKNQRKLYSKIFLGQVYLAVFLLLSLKDFWLNDESLDTIYLIIVILIGITFSAYKILSYKKDLAKLNNADYENDELLKFRLELINKEWDF